MLDVKACAKCEVVKPLSDFTKAAKEKDGLNYSCRACTRELSAAWSLENPERRTFHRRRQTLKKYGLTLAEYDTLFAAQEGLCAICRRPPGKKSLAVDHEHGTGRVRGLLC